MSATPDPLAYDPAEHRSAVEAWRSARLARLTAPDSWLSLVGRSPLDEGENSVGSRADCSIPLPDDRAPSVVGSFQRTGAAVTFTPAAGVSMSLRGSAGVQALSAGVAVRVRTDRDGIADKLVLDALTLEITDRESGMFVRVRDPHSATRQQFAGIEHFPLGSKWRVMAKLERYEPPKPLDLGYEAGSTQQYLSPGAALFEIDGVACSLEPVLDSGGKRLFVMFWDPTARDSTYGAGRFLYTALPEGDRLLLDFNLAFSPPCAFTPYAACPVVPTQNRLALRIEAGEKRPY